MSHGAQASCPVVHLHVDRARPRRGVDAGRAAGGPGGRARAAAHQPGPSGLPRGLGDPPGPGRPRHLPAGRGAVHRGAMDIRRAPARRELPSGRWGRLRPGDHHSRRSAYQLLRGVTYLQTSSGPNAGNVVLWMQPDGTLNLTPTPPDNPNPSDTGPSYWLARTIWALGEGYAAFRTVDPAFARFLRARLGLALDALDRQVLDPKYGTWQVVDGLRWPAWLIVDGADASSEALYGLVAYVRAGADARARRDLTRLASGIAAMPLGDARQWPFGAIMPWAQSRSVWHAWADQMAGALAEAGRLRGRPDWVGVAVGEVGRFTPHLLAQGGAENGWLPAPADRTQIAYGADATLQNLLRTAGAAGLPAFRDLAGVAAAWYFGNNPAGVAMYDPASGRTFDGISPDRNVNHNSGAESTIHGLLSMLALDAQADVAARARLAGRRAQVTWQLVEAEAGQLTGSARVVTPPAAWTGESAWSGGSYVELGPGGQGTNTLTLPVSGRYLLLPVFDRQQLPGGSVATRHALNGASAGVVDHGGAGAQGVTPTPGYLTVGTTPAAPAAAAGPAALLSVHVGDGAVARLDAVLVQPEVEWLVLGGGGGGQALLRSFARSPRTQAITLEGTGPTTALAYDQRGRLVATATSASGTVAAPVAPDGFTVVTR